MEEETKSPKQILKESLTTDLQQLTQKATNIDKNIVNLKQQSRNLEQQIRIATENFIRTLGAIDGVRTSINKLSLLDVKEDVE